MKIRLLGPFVLLFVLGLSSAALAATPSAKNARKSTLKELSNYGSFVYNLKSIPSEEEKNIHCSYLTRTKYKCNFKEIYSEADVNKGCVAGDSGFSYVIFYKRSTDVTIHLNPNYCWEQRR